MITTINTGKIIPFEITAFNNNNNTTLRTSHNG